MRIRRTTHPSWLNGLLLTTTLALSSSQLSATEFFSIMAPTGARSARFGAKLSSNRLVSETRGAVTGSIRSIDNNHVGAKWSEENGWVELGPPADDTNNHWFNPSGISADGATIVGHVRTGGTSDRFREASYWTSDEGIVSLKLGFSAYANAVSRDGNVIAGTVHDDNDQAIDVYRWTHAEGTEKLNIGTSIDIENSDMTVNGLSYDGRIRTGTSSTRRWNVLNDEGAMQEQAWIWSQDAGVHILDPPTPSEVTATRDMTPNGSLLVGYSGDYGDVVLDQFETVPTLWAHETVAQPLPDWSDDWWGQAIAVSDDGKTIVGNYREKSSIDHGGFIWRDGHGTIDIEDYFREVIDPEFDGEIVEILDMSGNRQWIVGTIRETDGLSRDPFAAKIPKSTIHGDFNENGLLDSQDIDLLASVIRAATTDAAFDVNGDGTVNQADRTWWVAQLARTFSGDANLDLVFNSDDIVTVFEAGEYEDGIALNSTWATGDWNGDAEFTSEDLVSAFVQGGYNGERRSTVVAVPEPQSFDATLLGLFIAARGDRSWGRRGDFHGQC